MNDLFNGVEDATDDSPEPDDVQLDNSSDRRTQLTQLGRFALFRVHKVIVVLLAGYGGLALGGIV